jgi:hypothetical protein
LVAARAAETLSGANASPPVKVRRVRPVGFGSVCDLRRRITLPLLILEVHAE